MELNRRDLLKTLVAVTGAVGMGGLVAGCSDDDDPPKKDTGGGNQDSSVDQTMADTGVGSEGGTPDTGGGSEGGAADTGAGSEGGMADNGAGDATGGDMATSCEHDTISNNHGHSLTIPMADVTAGAEKTYSIKGGSPHDHTVTVTAADFTKLGESKSITITSSTDSQHSHDVTVTC